MNEQEQDEPRGQHCLDERALCRVERQLRVGRAVDHHVELGARRELRLQAHHSNEFTLARRTLQHLNAVGSDEVIQEFRGESR